MKNKEITMRHEEKYMCSRKSMFLLENRIQALLPKDVHQDGAEYLIRSLYFDTYDDQMLQESLQGLRYRSKYRIRTYGPQYNTLHLEKKTSVGQLKQKSVCDISKEDVITIINGTYTADITEQAPLMQEFLSLQKCKRLEPKVIVEYNRSAYVNQNGNVRITFDKDIGASTMLGFFLSDGLLTHQILPDHLAIMEIKYDGILPGYLAKALNTAQLQRVSFSKYGLCRNIVENNGKIEEYYEF